MTLRLWAALSVLALNGLSALSLGGPVFYFISWMIIMMLAYGLLSALLARRLTTLVQGLDNPQVDRGGKARLTVGLSTKNPLPSSAVLMELTLPESSMHTRMYPGFLGMKQVAFTLQFNHVGVWPCGVQQLVFTDVFGLFPLLLEKRKMPQQNLTNVVKADLRRDLDRKTVGDVVDRHVEVIHGGPGLAGLLGRHRPDGNGGDHEGDENAAEHEQPDHRPDASGVAGYRWGDDVECPAL